MNLGTNFYPTLLIVFLSFVSFWAKAQAPQGNRPSATPTSSQVKPANLNQTAEQLFNKGEYDKVTNILWKDVDKIDRAGFILLARAHEKRNEPGDMARAMNLLIGKDPKDFEAHTYLGIAFLMQKKNKDSMEAFKRAIELNPKFEPAYNGLIKMYEMRNPPNLYELRILYQDMIDNIGSRPQYLSKLCEINTQDGTYEIALANCRDAILKDPTVASNHVYLAICQKATGDEANSAATLKKAALKFPTAEVAQYEYAKLLEEQKNFIDAMKYYKAATEAGPTSAKSWMGLASTSFEIRKFEVSLIAYKNACKFDRKNAAAFRKATTILRNNRNTEWSGKFESASESCTF
ncbi:Tetratricopeptide repeat protein [compost metagenome]